MRVLSLPDFRSANPYQSLLSDAAAKLGVTITYARGYKRVLPILRAVSLANKIDVLHLHWLHPYIRGGYSIRRFFFASRLLFELQVLRWQGVGLVWTVHNLTSHDTKSPKLEKWVSRRVAKLASQLIVHSEGAKSEVISEFGAPKEKVLVVPHGSYETAYGERMLKSEARQALCLPENDPVVMFFGLVRPYKNVLTILDAWPYVKSVLPTARLLICGSAPDTDHRSEIETKAATLTDVKLDLRFIPDEQVSALFGAADVVVLPFAKSLTSGTISLAETYATPVVVPLVEGTRSARNATFTKALNPEALAEAMISALSIEKEEIVREPVTVFWDEVAKKHVTAYQHAKVT